MSNIVEHGRKDTKQTALASENKNKIFFPTDDDCIVMGGKAYGDQTEVRARVQDHEQAIILHEAVAKALQTAGIKKLPNLTSLQAEYEQLQAQKETLYVGYGKLKKQVKEYDVIKRNIDSILRQDKEPEYNKEATRE